MSERSRTNVRGILSAHDLRNQRATIFSDDATAASTQSAACWLCGQLCRCLALVLGLGTASLGANAEQTTPASITPTEQPNFVIVVANDLGMECIGGYGGRSYQTPHIDRLLAAGMQFSHCFSNPYCSLSRGQLLTGRYPLHNGIKRVIFDPKQHREFLDPAHERSFANQLRDAGYATAMAGKWQLSFLEERDTIHDFGFDEYQACQIWVKGTKTSRYAQPTMRQNEVVLGPNQLAPYGPDANLAFLTDFIQRKNTSCFVFITPACCPTGLGSRLLIPAYRCCLPMAWGNGNGLCLTWLPTLTNR